MIKAKTGKRGKAKSTNKPKRPTKVKTRTHVAIVLDRSSSMQAIREETIAGFNRQVNTIRENAKDQEIRVSLVTFSDHSQEVFWNKDVEALKELNHGNYVPFGNTAMYDAVGNVLERLVNLPDASDPNTAFLVLVVSDGQENCSRTFHSRTVAPLVKALTNTGRWTFTYVGANQDLTQISHELNIPLQNTMTWVASSAGSNQAWSNQQDASQVYFRSRAAGAMASTNFYDQNGQGSTGVVQPQQPNQGQAGVQIQQGTQDSIQIQHNGSLVEQLKKAASGGK